MSDTSTSFDQLRRFPLLAGLSDEDFAAISSELEPRSANAGEVVVGHGQHGEGCGLILAGQASVRVHDEERTRLGPGDVFGEAGLLRNEMRNATVTATSDMRVITLSDFDLRRIKGEHPQFVERLEQVAQQRAR